MRSAILDSGQKIITNGLVLHLDAAQLRSYSGSGTTWTDLSGNGNNGTLTNGPTFNSGNGGYFTFDGTNDNTTFTYKTPAQDTNTTFTWNTWFYNTRNNDADILMGNRFNPEGILEFIKLTTNNFEYFKSGSPLILGIGTVTANQWNNITIVKNGSSFTSYNKSSQASTGTSTQSIFSQPFVIGGQNNEFYNGRVAITQVYNVALTSTEVGQNYNALKSRFGL